MLTLLAVEVEIGFSSRVTLPRRQAAAAASLASLYNRKDQD